MNSLPLEIKNIVVDYIKDLHIENKRLGVMKELLKKEKDNNILYALLEDKTLTLIEIDDIDNIDVCESYIIDIIDNEYYYKILNDVWTYIDDDVYSINLHCYNDYDFDIREYLFETFNIKICKCCGTKKSISWII